MFFYIVRVLVGHVVVSPDHMQPFFLVELPQEQIHIFVGLEKRSEMQVLPEFIPITKLNIMETLSKILLQCMEIDVAVVGKVIRKAVVSPVAIAEKDKPGLVVEGDHFGLAISPV